MVNFIIGISVGILNGMFASGAGQILVCYLIFMKKMDTHLVRALSVSILFISSIFTAFGAINTYCFKSGWSEAKVVIALRVRSSCSLEGGVKSSIR